MEHHAPSLRWLLRRACGGLASSAVFRRERALWETNQQDWELPLTRQQKLVVGVYLILRDYADGAFPPRFECQQQTHAAEIRGSHELPGRSAVQITADGMRKPFVYGSSRHNALAPFLTLCQTLERCGVRPPQRVLELGCGHGWLSELLALMGFEVCGTTIAEYHVERARRRIHSVQAKGVEAALEFRAAPMETVDQAVADLPPFDAVLVFDALHHAHDWRQVLGAARACLRPGGWLLICNEPNVLHTCISYRASLLSESHEVGLSRTAMVRRLRRLGFARVRSMHGAGLPLVRRHWIMAQV